MMIPECGAHGGPLRTCVRMGRPYRPARELEAHLDRGELGFAIALAKTVTSERGRPLDLDLTIRFLPLVATQRPDDFDVWALRWLERWCAELRSVASIDDAVELVVALAEIPVDPDQAMGSIRVVRARHQRPGPGL
jgi:hypothetical protein